MGLPKSVYGNGNLSMILHVCLEIESQEKFGLNNIIRMGLMISSMTDVLKRRVVQAQG